MRTEDLQAKGLTQEQIDFVFTEHGKEINAIKDERDKIKGQLDEAQKTLKSFEGVDVSELQSKITELTNEIATNQADFDKKIADRDFNDLVKAIAGEYKVRDVKAVMPFLDVEALKASKNQDKDIKAAFDVIKKEQDYLFESDKRVPFVVSSTPGPLNQNNTDPNDKKALANEAFRGLFGK